MHDRLADHSHPTQILVDLGVRRVHPDARHDVDLQSHAVHLHNDVVHLALHSHEELVEVQDVVGHVDVQEVVDLAEVHDVVDHADVHENVDRLLDVVLGLLDDVVHLVHLHDVGPRSSS